MVRKVKLKRKWKLFRKKSLRKSQKIVLIIICLLVSLCLCFYKINQSVSPILIHYAETEMKHLSSLVITKAVTKQMTEQLKFDDLFLIDKNDNGEINTIDFNPAIVNKVLATCTATVQLNLKYIEEGKLDLIDIPDTFLMEYKDEKNKEGIIFEIPSGVVFQNALLNNIGPKIPVRLNLIGDIQSNIHTKISDYGINNALIEVFVNIKVNEQVILPFVSKTITVENNIPVAIKIMSGKIPESYFGTIGKDSNTLSIPVK